MKKKFLIIISSILCFIGLAFLITMRSSMPVLALGNVSISENDTFSNDILVDLDYYNSFDSSVDSTNYFSPSYLVSTWSDSGISNVSFATGYLRFNSNASWRYVYYRISASPNTAYYFNYSTISNNWVSTIVDNNNTTLYSANTWNTSSNVNIVFTTKSNTSSVTFKFSNMQHVVNPDSANVISPIAYSNIFFRKTDIDNKPLFGFAIHTTNSSITSSLSYIESISGLGDLYYLPFNISTTGKVSFNYTFPVGANVDFHSIVIKNKINGVVNNKIKLQYSYSNFSLGYKSITFIDDTPSSGDNWYGLIFQSDPPQVKIQSGKSSVYYANFKSEVYNYLYASDFIDHTDYLYYSQVLGFGSYAGSSNGKRTISFESLVCSSFGSGGGIVIPDNPDNEYEVYKEVSGPFDFTTMIYNAFTWIIFNVPVIGPVLNVLRSARVMFSSVVSIGQLFTGFGVIFSIFIVCLILYIIKHLNGGD